MPGIVSLLDAEASQTVIEVRQRLDDELDVQTPIQNHHPHLSYQIAAQYDDERVSEGIQEIANEQESFAVRTNGIGVFSDSDPLIVYIPVVRDSHLSAFHSRVWDNGEPAGTDLQEYYHPERWTPHITIAPVEQAELPSVMSLLGEYSFYWEVEVGDIAMIVGDAPNRRVEHRTPLDGTFSAEHG